MTEESNVTTEGIKSTLKDFLVSNFLPSAGVDTINDTDSFMEEGIVDSTGVLELLEFIEDKFSIQVEDGEIIPDNLDSLNNLTVYIHRKLTDAG